MNRSHSLFNILVIPNWKFSRIFGRTDINEISMSVSPVERNSFLNPFWTQFIKWCIQLFKVTVWILIFSNNILSVYQYWIIIWWNNDETMVFLQFFLLNKHAEILFITILSRNYFWIFVSSIKYFLEPILTCSYRR